jgi:hypothetical protein
LGSFKKRARYRGRSRGVNVGGQSCIESRRAVMANSGADPGQLAAEIVAFVDRALAVHPGDSRLLAVRAQLLLPVQPGVTTPGRPAMTPP